MALPQLLRMVQELKGTLVTVMGKLVPSGVILMWSGSTDTIPAGWALCNGQNGTPDLTDRFILGAGKTYQPGTTGGAATVTPSVAASKIIFDSSEVFAELQATLHPYNLKLLKFSLSSD